MPHVKAQGAAVGAVDGHGVGGALERQVAVLGGFFRVLVELLGQGVLGVRRAEFCAEAGDVFHALDRTVVRQRVVFGFDRLGQTYEVVGIGGDVDAEVFGCHTVIWVVGLGDGATAPSTLARFVRNETQGKKASRGRKQA